MLVKVVRFILLYATSRGGHFSKNPAFSAIFSQKVVVRIFSIKKSAVYFYFCPSTLCLQTRKTKGGEHMKERNNQNKNQNQENTNQNQNGNQNQNNQNKNNR